LIKFAGLYSVEGSGNQNSIVGINAGSSKGSITSCSGWILSNMPLLVLDSIDLGFITRELR